MTWSISESKIFRKCQRQWYFKACVANAIAKKDPLRRRAYLLGKLQTISGWRGQIVDTVISKHIVPAINANRTITLSMAQAEARKLFETQLAFARQHRLHEPGLPITDLEGTFAAFYSMEYEGRISEDEVERARVEVDTALKNLFHLRDFNASITELRTSYTYNEDGTVDQVTDPRAKVRRTLYDDLGRTVTTIQNYINGTSSGATADDDLVTRFEYTSGLQTRMWVDIDGDAVVDGVDQVTTYIYGTVKATPSQSKIASGHLLRAVLYPDTTNTGTDHLDINSDSDDVESFAYNAQGQPTLKKDQIGNTYDMDYDTAGRLLHRRVTNLDGSFDMGSVVGTELPQPDVFSRRYTGASTG